MTVIPVCGLSLEGQFQTSLNCIRRVRERREEEERGKGSGKEKENKKEKNNNINVTVETQQRTNLLPKEMCVLGSKHMKDIGHRVTRETQVKTLMTAQLSECLPSTLDALGSVPSSSQKHGGTGPES